MLGDPRHPYTRRLIAAAPSLHVDDAIVSRARSGYAVADAGPASVVAREPRAVVADDVPVLEVEGLVKEFALPGGGRVRAVDDVSFALERGRTLALVGESGSGKTTTARLALRLADPTAGRVRIDGTDVTDLAGRRLRELRRRIQLVQQNPYAALNPRWNVETLIADPLRAFRVGSRADRRRRAAELLDLVALPSTALTRRPADLSGGQRQRVAIARALAIEPELLVLDEPVSALDVSIQHQILTLLADIQRETAIGYLFISHDLAVVRQIADTVGVMRRGRLVEIGAADDVFARPAHDYTRALLDAIPGHRSPTTRSALSTLLP